MFRHNGNFYFQKCWDLKADIERLERERDALKSQLAAERAEGERLRDRVLSFEKNLNQFDDEISMNLISQVDSQEQIAALKSRAEAAERLVALSQKLAPWVSASVDDQCCDEYVALTEEWLGMVTPSGEAAKCPGT